MIRKVTAILICAVFVFSLLASNYEYESVLAAEADIYAVDWSQFQTGDIISNEPKEGLTKSGGAEITVVGTDNKSLYVSNRKDNWDALDILNSYLKLDRTATYAITITGHVDSDVNTEGASIKLGGVSKKEGESDGYPEFKKEKLEAGKSFTLTQTLKISELIPDAARELTVLRVQTDEASQATAGALVPFYVDGIVITQTASGEIPGGELPSVETPTGDSITLYELSKDVNLKMNGAELDSSTLKRSGSGTVAVEAGTDGAVSLAVTNRVNNFDGVDILRDSLKINNAYSAGTYTFVVKGHVAPDVPANSASFVLSMTESPWRELTSRTSPASDGSFELKYTKEYAKASDLATLDYDFRIQSPPSIYTSFYIDDIIITVTGSSEPEVTDLLVAPFDNEAEQGHLFTVAKSSTIAWVNAPGIGKDSDTALKVSHTPGKSYIGMENAVQLTLDDPLPVGGTYRISAWFYAPVEENQGKSTLTGPGIVLNGEYGNATAKFPGDFGTLPLGVWKEVNVTLPIQETPIKNIDFRIVENSAERYPEVWYLDNIVISQIGELTERVIPKWDLTLDSLAKAYENYFLIGNVMEPSQTENADNTAMYNYHYNVVTPENAMKPVSLTKEKDVYLFEPADKLVKWAEDNGLLVHGHTLVWHSQSAPWLTMDADRKVLTRAEAKTNLENYINTVAGHYKGKVISWDVVNEVFQAGVSAVPADWRDALRTNQGTEGSTWYQAYENGADKSKGESGSDYIYDAFVLARLADPGATLYYNDFNETMIGKREAIASMVEELNAAWKNDSRNTQPERLLIEGIGMQAHYWTSDLKASDVEASIVRFIKTGVEISVSEVDIPFGNHITYKERTVAPTAEEELLQADLYKRVFEVYAKYYENIARVTIWGKADPQSWRSEGYPLLFDKEFVPKPAYWSVMEVAKNLDTKEPEEPKSTETEESKSTETEESKSTETEDTGDTIAPKDTGKSKDTQDTGTPGGSQGNIKTNKGQNNTKAPKTGDTTVVLTTVVLLILSCAMLIVICLKRRVHHT